MTSVCLGRIALAVGAGWFSHQMAFAQGTTAKLYSVDRGSALLRELNPATGATIPPTITMTLAGRTITGATGLAADPVTRRLYALLRLEPRLAEHPSVRQLVTVDPATGVVTDIGPAGGALKYSFADIAFDSAGVLYGVTGDGSPLAARQLYTLNTSTGEATFVMSLGNGDDGETIAFNPDDNRMYHSSGKNETGVVPAPFNLFFESIDLRTRTVLPRITLIGPRIQEAAALVYAGGGAFLWSSLDFNGSLSYSMMRVTSTGAITTLGPTDHLATGLAFALPPLPTNQVPTLASLSPRSATSGGGALTLTVTGQGFVSGAKVQWNGANRDTTVVSPTQVTALIPASDLAVAGTAQVTVVNPAPGGGASTALSFSIDPVVPTTPPVINTPPAPQTIVVGGPVTFTSAATGAGLSYQWLFNSSPVAGATGSTYTISTVTPANAGSYSVRVTNAGGTVTSSAAVLTPSFRGQYSGNVSGQGVWAMDVRLDNTGTFIAHDRTNARAYQQPVIVRVDGRFSDTGAIVQTPSLGEARGVILSGQIQSGQVTGQLGGSNTTFSGSRDQDSGSGQMAGYHFARALGAGGGAMYAVVGPSGRITLVVSSANAADSATGLLTNLGQLSATTTGGVQIQVNVNGQLRTFEATLRPAGIAAPIPFLGLFDGVPSTARLVNLSILTVLAASGDSFTVGTVIGGARTTGTKPLLVRAAGPALTPLGVGGALPDPKVDLYRGQAVIASNDNWGGTAALASAFAQVGAFAFPSSASRDAAVYEPALASGGYTVEVAGVGGATGAVIAELYDATPSNAVTAATPRLVNVSVLKPIGAGEILTAGFVIGGVGPMQVLIRAVGPTLGNAPFNVPGAMSDPKVDLFSGQSVIASSDNWGGGADLVAGFAVTGAFALPAASRDAAVLAVLQPGSYTAQVSGVGGSAGAALVEVYEVP